MRTYYVQLESVEEAVYIHADANPELGADGMWIFKQNDEIVGRVKASDVIGWWYFPENDD